MHRNHRQIGQDDARIQRDDFRIIPLGDVAEENVGDDVAVQLQLWRAGQVVDDGHAAGDDRNVQDFPRSLRQIVVAHRRVGSAEVHRLLEQLLLAPAGADGLIIEVNRRIHRAVGFKPFGEGRVIKGRTRTVDELCRRVGRSNEQCRAAHDRETASRVGNGQGDCQQTADAKNGENDFFHVRFGRFRFKLTAAECDSPVTGVRRKCYNWVTKS